MDFNKELKDRVAQGLVNVQKHPTQEYFIYNYSPRVQYESLWDEITTQCRGLILDSEMNVVARPFPKFFNYEEIKDKSILDKRFDAFEKLDGSLGIMYWIGEKPYIATRGSFVSDQALNATSLLHNRYKGSWGGFNRDYTYLFEIIYPENRIVVDYGEINDIFFITAIHKETKEERFFETQMPCVQMYRSINRGISDIEKLRALQEANKEGLVLRFENNFRIKIKFDEYVRLHKILTGVSSKTIWEYLRGGGLSDELLEKIPDEFYRWVKEVASKINSDFEAIVNECKSVYCEFPSRKEAAEFFTKQKYPSILFSMLDERDYSEIVWKIIKPKHTKAFKNEGDNN